MANNTAWRIIGIILVALAIAAVAYSTHIGMTSAVNIHQPSATVQVSKEFSDVLERISDQQKQSDTRVVTIPFKAGIHGYWEHYFHPASLTINVGDKVSWINKDTVVHTATGQTFDSNLIWPAGYQNESKEFNGVYIEFTHTFTQPGTFHYSCQLHPHMTGKVTVLSNNNS